MSDLREGGMAPVADPSSPPEPRRTPARRGARRRTSPTWRYLYPAAMVLLTIAVPILAWTGIRVVLDSKDGKELNPVIDPSAPGYEALVEPTPTMLMVQTDASDHMVGLTFIALTGEEDAAVLLLPVATVPAEAGPVDPEDPPLPFKDIYAQGGIDELTTSVEEFMKLGIDEVVQVDAGRWAELVAPVAPLTLDNLDPIVAPSENGENVEIFASGELQLAAEDVPRYLEARNVDENDLNRLLRHEAFWKAWNQAIVDSGEAETAVPGEVDSGIGRFVRGLSGSVVTYIIPDATTLRIPGATEDVYLLDGPGLAQTIAAIVPFPKAAFLGQRVLVRVLDGTGDPDMARQAAEVLVRAGAEIDIIGNAENFDYTGSQIVYFVEDREGAADAMVKALGGGIVVFNPSDGEAVDLTVIVGADFDLSAVPPSFDDFVPLEGATTVPEDPIPPEGTGESEVPEETTVPADEASTGGTDG